MQISKLLQFRKTLAGIGVGGLLLAGGATIPLQDTDYQVFFRETFATQEDLVRYKTLFSDIDYQVVEEKDWQTKGLTMTDKSQIAVIGFKQFHATSTDEVRRIVKKNPALNANMLGVYVEAKTLLNTYVRVYDELEIGQEVISNGKNPAETTQAKNIKQFTRFMANKVFGLFVSQDVLAAYGTDDFETSYSPATDLDGINGGTGFGAWGNGALTCPTNYEATSTAPLTGSTSGAKNGNTGDGGYSCQRAISPANTSTADIFMVNYMTITAGVNSIIGQLTQASTAMPGAYCVATTALDLKCYSNTTLTDTSDDIVLSTKFKFEFNVVAFGVGGTFRVRKDGGTWRGNYTFYDSTTNIAQIDQLTIGVTTDNLGAVKFDDLGAEAVPVVPPIYDDYDLGFD